MARGEEEGLLSVEEARDLILSHISPLPPREFLLPEAVGLVLAEDAVATSPIPAHDNCAVDGYAVRWRDVEGASPGAPARLRWIGDLPAGKSPELSLREGEAIRVGTGAPTPPGADTVVPVEDTRLEGVEVLVLRDPGEGANIRRAGEDVREGEVVLRAGRLLWGPDLGILAAIGKWRVLARPRPRVAILSTGDEVVEPWEEMGPGKVRDANSYMLAALVAEAGGVPIRLGISPDRNEPLEELLKRGLGAGDAVIASGGVSMGAHDLMKEVLSGAGELRLWQVAMQPGRPLAFATASGKPVFGLPGNPVAVFVSFHVFVLPALWRMAGREGSPWRRVRLPLAEPVRRKPGRAYFLRAKLIDTPGGAALTLTGPQGSGILSSCVAADAIIVVPPERTVLEAGAEVEAWLLPPSQVRVARRPVSLPA